MTTISRSKLRSTCSTRPGIFVRETRELRIAFLLTILTAASCPVLTFRAILTRPWGMDHINNYNFHSASGHTHLGFPCQLSYQSSTDQSFSGHLSLLCGDAVGEENGLRTYLVV